MISDGRQPPPQRSLPPSALSGFDLATILSVSSAASVFSKAGEDTDADTRLLPGVLMFSPWLCGSVVNLSTGGITRRQADR